ncbi:hypothetical protein [Pseudomonas sp. B21-053]|uniref:hypothetical protein n=1 Tax=Pseudomonas sp. B21-053 TaxID=2895493 RepID=UPI00223133AD|nr:hypothetical protein [Pseudomonas sp. B21-053]UZE11875.1 hypothetical protein LOY68_31230 [Pseudomonas sp. B21-053]
MKNFVIFLLLSFATGCCANANENILLAPELPKVMLGAISERNATSVDKVKIESGGALKWGSEYLVSISIKGEQKSCSVYKYTGNILFSLFNGVPCEFKGPADVNESRNTSMPDILYKIKLYLPNRGAMTDEMIALYFDEQKATYCLSGSLSDWYQNSDKKYPPDLSDGQCGYGPGE